MAALPRPDLGIDPHFAVRSAIGLTLAYALVEPLGVAAASILPAMAVSQICSQRGDYNPAKTFVGAGITIALLWSIYGVVVLVRQEMLVFVVATFAILYGAFYVMLRTGNPVSTLVLIFTTLLSVLAVNSVAAAETMRDAFTVTSVVTALLFLLLNLMLPARRVDMAVAPRVASPGDPQAGLQALLRLLALAPVLLGLWFVFPSSGIIAPLMSVLVLAYPTRDAQRTEAFERMTATLLGGVVALGILLLFSWQAHFPVLFGLIFLVALHFTGRMVDGRASPNTYQVALSVITVLVSTGMTSPHPMQDAAQRVVLTFLGTGIALGGLASLESLIIPNIRPQGATPSDV